MLNPLLYFKRNIKDCLLILIISSLAILVVSFAVTVISSISLSTTKVVVEQFEKYSVATYTGHDDNAKAIIEEKLPNVEIFDSFINYTDFETAFGSNSVFLYSFFDDDTMLEIFNRCNFSLTDGRMPKKNCDEIILHESILKNKNLSVGDKIESQTIVGSINGKCIIGLGFLSDKTVQRLGYLTLSYVVFSDNENSEQTREALEKFDSDEWKVFTYIGLEKKLHDEMKTLNLIMVLIIFMIVSCLSIAVSALIFSIYSNRYDEFAILNAIGYKKMTIGISIISEITILALISWIVGFGFSLIGMMFVNKTIYFDLGQQMPLFNIQSFYYSLLLPFLSIICAVIPVSRKLSKTDLIGIIERR